MANNDDSELFSYLFALRLQLTDTYDNEYTIMIELKKYLTQKNFNNDQINQKLFDFYNHFDMNIPLETIKDIPNGSQNINDSDDANEDNSEDDDEDDNEDDSDEDIINNINNSGAGSGAAYNLISQFPYSAQYIHISNGPGFHLGPVL